MNYKYQFLFSFAVCMLVFSCSTRKNRFLNKNFHAVTSKYNILFNGKEALKEGIAAIHEKYEDDYWELLPIEPLKFEEENTIRLGSIGGGFDGELDSEEQPQAATPFDKAEEKAVKTIQKHGMNIYGKERNSQIDDAYLLLGKARYYSQRFIPAIEAFNYVIANYPRASLINETKIWRAKANIRNDNEEFAIESLKLFITHRIKILSDEIKEQAYTALAMAYLKTDSIQCAIESLKKATITDSNKNQTARNLFILGQLYGLENQKNAATEIFNNLIAYKKAPYKYKINAYIELVKNSAKDANSLELTNSLQKLIKNRDNRSYLDKLYYQVGVLEENKDSIEVAVFNYNKSLQAKNGSDKQKTFTYERLGNLNFEVSNYIAASAYYDSVLQIARNTKDSTHIRIRRVKRKHKSLASLIDFEGIVKQNDSILTIVAMPEAEQKTFFENYIAKLKKADEERAQQQLNAQSFNAIGNDFIQPKNKGEWYFYNGQSSKFGSAEFKKVWGNRVLEDNWRWSSNTSSSNAITTETSEKEESIPKEYELATYLEGIPTAPQIIDSLKVERNESLFELGLIYKEQFRNSPLAIARLERLLELQPKEKLKLSAHYYLYQIYKNLKNTSKENFHSNIILTSYPETSFAEMIKFPNERLEEGKTGQSTALYQSFYNLYKEGKYEKLFFNFNKNLEIIEKSILISKFELLKAYAIGKHKPKKAFRLAMEYVAFVYAETGEGKEAQDIVIRLKKE